MAVSSSACPVVIIRLCSTTLDQDTIDAVIGSDPSRNTFILSLRETPSTGKYFKLGIRGSGSRGFVRVLLS